MRPVKAVVVACGTLLAFPALSAAHGVRVAHAAAATPTQTITVGSAPWGVAADPNSGMVYVSNYNSDTLSVIDEATDKVTATIPVGPAPEAVAVNRRPTPSMSPTSEAKVSPSSTPAPTRSPTRSTTSA